MEIFAALYLIFFIAFCAFAHKIRWSAVWRRFAARKNLAALPRLLERQGPKAVFAFLRSVDPFVFEEMILGAYKRQGRRIVRNKRYWGDGGIDGRVWIDGEKRLIQAKRYRREIRIKHVRDFLNVCEAKRMRGLLVHTGRTPAPAWAIARKSARIEIISGDRLLDLFCGGHDRVSERVFKS